MKTSADISQLTTATCPACGMLCDDIVVETGASIQVKNGCAKSVAFFEQSLANATPTISGAPASLGDAITATVDILQTSKQALFAGLGTEVKGMRALVSLAQKVGATLDHMHSESTVRNTLAMQNRGWQTTTLTEVKNRADVILAIGTDITSTHPRFLSKLVNHTDSLFDKKMPEVMYLCEDKNQQHLPEIMSVLNAIADQKKLTINKVADIEIQALENIVSKIKAAKYAVIVWSASNLKFAHAELTVQSITRLIAKLNETTRVAGLPLNSGDGDTSVNNTSTWLTGYPTRSRIYNAQAEYKPEIFSTQQQFTNCDAMLWVSTFNAYTPPVSDVPTIVIGHPNTQFTKTPDVFIPVSIPGLTHTGTMFRMDSAVALPLKKVRDTNLPNLAHVIEKILEKLPC